VRALCAASDDDDERLSAARAAHHRLAAALAWSAAVSVKMNALLFAPALALLMLRAARTRTIFAAVALALGLQARTLRSRALWGALARLRMHADVLSLLRACVAAAVGDVRLRWAPPSWRRTLASTWRARLTLGAASSSAGPSTSNFCPSTSSCRAPPPLRCWRRTWRS
jgi:cation transport ATPase